LQYIQSQLMQAGLALNNTNYAMDKALQPLEDLENIRRYNTTTCVYDPGQGYKGTLQLRTVMVEAACESYHYVQDQRPLLDLEQDAASIVTVINGRSNHRTCNQQIRQLQGHTL